MTIATILLRLFAGTLLGVFFYGGLNFTVRRLATTHYPVLWTLGGVWLRFSVTIGGFLFLMAGRWDYALLLLAGFTLGRLVCM
jgi:F1F0 ATPase subunit 2